jgi:hypothetical protein
MGKNNTIPPMVNPLGKHWSQPSRDDILVDDTHAIMSEATLKKLADYSLTMPTGAYEGKMWKRRKGYRDGIEVWLLAWYGEDPEPGFVSNNFREVILI